MGEQTKHSENVRKARKALAVVDARRMARLRTEVEADMLVLINALVEEARLKAVALGVEFDPEAAVAKAVYTVVKEREHKIEEGVKMVTGVMNGNTWDKMIEDGPTVFGGWPDLSKPAKGADIVALQVRLEKVEANLWAMVENVEKKLAEYEELIEAQDYDIPSSLKKLYTINERRNRLAENCKARQNRE